MKYPGLPKELDSRRKLNEVQIKEIKKLYSQGWSQRKLGKEFGVSQTAIRYHVIDSNTREEMNKKRYERIMELVATDSEYAEKRRKQKIRNSIDLMKKTPELRTWKAKATYKWKKKKYHSDESFREKTKLQARESYHRKLEVVEG